MANKESSEEQSLAKLNQMQLSVNTKIAPNMVDCEIFTSAETNNDTQAFDEYQTTVSSSDPNQIQLDNDQN